MAIFAKLRGLFGQEVPAKPDRELMLSRPFSESVRDRQSLESVLGNLTPQRLRSIFCEADEGYLGRQVELAETIEERDTHVRSVLQTRRLAAAGLEYAISPGDESDQAREAADEFRAVWQTLRAHSPVRLLLKAVLPQWAALRIIWDTQGKRWTPIGLEEVDCRRLVWPQTDAQGSGFGVKGSGENQFTPALPALSVDWSMSNTVPLTPGAYIIHSVDAIRGRPGRMAMVRTVSFWWMAKRFAAIDWATLLEQFGRPWRAVKYDANMTRDQISALLKVLKEAAADLCVAIPKTSELQLLQGMTGSGQSPHEAFERFADQQISKAIVGATTIADAAEGNQSVSSPTHGVVVFEAIRNADALSCAADICRDLIGPWTLWNYGPSVAAPEFKPKLDEDEDAGTRADVYTKVSPLRLKVKSDQLYRELGIERPDGVDDVIELGAPNGQTAEQSNSRADVAAAISSQDLEFKKEVLRLFLQDRTVNDILFNIVSVRTLVEQTGLPVDPNYVEPWVPARDDTGALISGDVIKDKEGDIVGGAVIPGTAPVATVFGGGQPGQQTERAIEQRTDEGAKRNEDGNPTGGGSGTDSGSRGEGTAKNANDAKDGSQKVDGGEQKPGGGAAE